MGFLQNLCIVGFKSIIIIGDLGDYMPEVHMGNYVSDFKILLKQTETIEEKIMEIHQKNLKGQTPPQVESSFLKLACQLDTYGVDPHPVKVCNITYRFYSEKNCTYCYNTKLSFIVLHNVNT